MEKRKAVIFHIDVNSAFLSWEAVYRLCHLGGTVDLRKQVSAVGGDMAMRHGIILAKSIPAKKYHIHTGETILEAKQKCPELILVPPNYGLYEKCSKAFMDILRQYSPSVEQYSIDEAFVDMSGTEGLWGEPVAAAERIKDQIRDTLGFTVNIGVSENKLLAKMASDFQKPDRVHTLWKEEIREKIHSCDMLLIGIGQEFEEGQAKKEERLETMEQLLEKSSLLGDFKAVQNGNAWCTGKNLFQETTGIGTMIADMHQMLTEDDPSLTELTYMHKLQ